MHTTTRSRSTDVVGAISLVLGLVISILALLAGPAFADGFQGTASSDPAHDTCKDADAGFDPDFSDNKVNTPNVGDGASGDWGSIVKTGEQEATATINEGYTVDICIKTGSAVTVYSGASCDHGEADDEVACVVVYDSSGRGGGVSHVSWRNAQFTDPDPDPDPAEPQVEVGAECDDTTPTAMVTITNPDAVEFSYDVFIDDALEDTITEAGSTTYDGDALSTLTVQDGDDVLGEATFDECTEPEVIPSTASFTTGSECQEDDLPALTYDATISETADDPVGEVTLTVSDADGEVATTTFSESESGSIVLPTSLEGATVNVSWDFDDTTTQQTLPSLCGDELGITDEQDPDPGTDTEDETEELPSTEVKGEQLPNTGAEHVILGLLAGGFLMLGGSILLMSNRRRRVFA